MNEELTYEEIVNEARKILGVRKGDSLLERCDDLVRIMFLPQGESHHDATKCPYCQSNLNGKT